jgi:hypothetical protein
MSRFVSCVAVSALAVVVGCNASFGAPDVIDAGFVDCDAGVPVDVVLDDGQCVPLNQEVIEGEGEGETDDPDRRDANCAQLVTKTCGAAAECGNDPGCVAADLVSRFEPERCSDARSDNVGFPPCTGGACDRLVDKVCGATCTDAPGCTPAQTLLTRSDDGDASASASCASALSDETLFPPCAE